MWVILFGLFALIGQPIPPATSVLVFLAAGVATAVMLSVWKESARSIAEVPHRAETLGTVTRRRSGKRLPSASDNMFR